MREIFGPHICGRVYDRKKDPFLRPLIDEERTFEDLFYDIGLYVKK